MVLKSLLSGFFVKIITGFDDLMIHIPLLASMAKTKRGRIAFVSGISIAIFFVVILSFLFASIIKLIPYFKYIASTLIFILAISIYFDIFIHKPKTKVKQKLKKVKRISTKRFIKLLGLGFITAFVTVIDDAIAYSSLFLGDITNSSFVILGIFIATGIEITSIFYFSKVLAKIKYKKEITSIGLIILGILILFEVL